MKQLASFIILFISISAFSQGPWTQEKGKLYTQFSFSTIPSYDELFGNPDYKTTGNIPKIYSDIATNDLGDVSDEDLPKEVIEFRNNIAAADGVIFCTPEYVFSIPGSLKNAIEWCVSTTVFSHKPVATIIAAASGEKAYESLSLIMTTIEAVLPEESKLLIQGAKGKVNVNSEITDSTTLEQLENVIQSLISTIKNEDKRPTKLR